MAVLGNPDMLTRKINLCHINAHITCRLCEGYLIDATTVTECLHTFCRSCLVKYLEENNTCPTCRIVIHQSHPLQYIGHDRTMQDIVYKLVPGLQEAEIKKQREFYQKLGMEVPGDVKGELCNMKIPLDQRNGDAKSEDTTNKEAGEEKPEEDNDYHRSDEQVSICLECNSSKLRGLKRKWIRCSAQATVLHLKKFIAKKLNLTSFNELDILCNEEILGKDHTLKFVVVTRWRFKCPSLLMRLHSETPPPREFLCPTAVVSSRSSQLEQEFKAWYLLPTIQSQSVYAVSDCNTTEGRKSPSAAQTLLESLRDKVLSGCM
ncbi:polycomb group RING finger protein 3 isoform X1 [Oryzias latipes]|uniref:Polycomb group RING finger protein 3 n=1 Tax=Oryzias latipes TaxID=8090 RepID=A0A3B3HPD0_ORYLA|nr:polycomb group RING finger protein 3 isoform X1 [Oryzias latipes]XP_023815157.1 polycomb group RING finger protein 3 isoform X1 [Oryzias latipes]XP_023815158.1 polycomb group RING finger protein 3 isoform X1 [Oryzias latipes]